VAESLAKHWACLSGKWAAADTSTGMDDESADALRLPDKAVVVDYARRVFARRAGRPESHACAQAVRCEETTGTATN
jgi:hypothetical protein